MHASLLRPYLQLYNMQTQSFLPTTSYDFVFQHPNVKKALKGAAWK